MSLRDPGARPLDPKQTNKQHVRIQEVKTSVLATRKPMPLIWSPGSSLKRKAERQFLGNLLQDPLHTTFDCILRS